MSFLLGPGELVPVPLSTNTNLLLLLGLPVSPRSLPPVFVKSDYSCLLYVRRSSGCCWVSSGFLHLLLPLFHPLFRGRFFLGGGVVLCVCATATVASEKKLTVVFRTAGRGDERFGKPSAGLVGRGDVFDLLWDSSSSRSSSSSSSSSFCCCTTCVTSASSSESEPYRCRWCAGRVGIRSSQTRRALM